MGDLSSYQSSRVTKAIVMADTGGGKSGALAALANVGYRLHIMDTDNGLDILRNLFLANATRYKKEAIDNISVRTVTEAMRTQGNLRVPASAKAWDTCISLFDKFITNSGIDEGSIYKWDDMDVLVIDSFTRLCNYAMNKALALNSRLGAQPYQSDWGEAQRMIEAVLQTLYDSQVKCNVIVNCHLVAIGQEDTTTNKSGDVVKFTISGTERKYPMSLGKALSPKVGQYFNTALYIENRKIYTKTRGIINLKSSNPFDVPESLPIETGLADYFKAVRISAPPPKGTQGTP